MNANIKDIKEQDNLEFKLNYKIQDFIPGVGVYTFLKRLANHPIHLDDSLEKTEEFNKQLDLQKNNKLAAYFFYQLATTSAIAVPPVLFAVLETANGVEKIINYMF